MPVVNGLYTPNQRWIKNNQYLTGGLGNLGALSLQINKPSFFVGETPTYTITGAAPNTEVTWSSTRAGQATGENMSDYGQKTDANGSLVGPGNPWQDTQQGSWTKTANVGSESSTVAFQVVPYTASAGPVWAPSANQNYTGSYAGSALTPSSASGQTINLFGYNLPAWVVYGGGFIILWSFLNKKK